mmetsp:Transcript_9156/g.34212  ORF Transcript_9156/g.34212 Transcript_9156/m.34212 type:complete len:264 (+) Transcript_9156:127-918(+)
MGSSVETRRDAVCSDAKYARTRRTLGLGADELCEQVFGKYFGLRLQKKNTLLVLQPHPLHAELAFPKFLRVRDLAFLQVRYGHAPVRRLEVLVVVLVQVVHLLQVHFQAVHGNAVGAGVGFVAVPLLVVVFRYRYSNRIKSHRYAPVRPVDLWQTNPRGPQPLQVVPRTRLARKNVHHAGPAIHQHPVVVTVLAGFRRICAFYARPQARANHELDSLFHRVQNAAGEHADVSRAPRGCDDEEIRPPALFTNRDGDDVPAFGFQ